MTDITMIGLGKMGAALARAQLRAGQSVTVWNRDAEKMAPLEALGARPVGSVAAAVQASPVILVCIDNYAATRQLLEAAAVVPHLARRTLVQFSTGTPKAARDAETWLKDRGADYLDGALMFYPDAAGAAESLILIAGQQAAYERCEGLLRNLGGDLRTCGENIGTATTLDLAVLAYSLGSYTGFAHGARLCEAEGVGAKDYAALFPEGGRARQLAEIVHADAYQLGSLHPGATVRVWGGVARQLQSQADDAGMNSELPDFLSEIFQRCIAAGHGEEDIAALVKVLRN